MTEQLSLAHLTAFDPRGGRGGTWRRWCCPFCGAGKPVDEAHRSLSIKESGFRCHRCGITGRIADADALHPSKLLALPPRVPLARVSEPPEGEDPLEKVRRAAGLLRPLAGSPGATYLAGRGIDVGPDGLHDVRFAWTFPTDQGRGAVVFAVRGERGQIVALQGRFIDGGKHRMQTAGTKSLGVYRTRADVFSSSAFAVTEAPIDALTITGTVGLPAVALLGCEPIPFWLRRKVLGRTVFIATDADEAGDKAAVKLRAALDPFGAFCVRVNFGPANDANALLVQQGAGALGDCFSAAVAMTA